MLTLSTLEAQITNTGGNPHIILAWPSTTREELDDFRIATGDLYNQAAVTVPSAAGLDLVVGSDSAEVPTAYALAANYLYSTGENSLIGTTAPVPTQYLYPDDEIILEHAGLQFVAQEVPVFVHDWTLDDKEHIVIRTQQRLYQDLIKLIRPFYGVQNTSPSQEISKQIRLLLQTYPQLESVDFTVQFDKLAGGIDVSLSGKLYNACSIKVIVHV